MRSEHTHRVPRHFCVHLPHLFECVAASIEGGYLKPSGWVASSCASPAALALERTILLRLELIWREVCRELLSRTVLMELDEI